MCLCKTCFSHTIFAQLISMMMQISSDDMAVGIWWCSSSLFPGLRLFCGTSKLPYTDVWEEWCLCGLNNQMHLAKSCLALHEVVWECVWAGIYTWFLMALSMLLFGLMSQLEDIRTFSFLKFLYLLCKNRPTSHPAYMRNILNLHPNPGSYAFSLQLQTLHAQHEIILFLWPTTLMWRCMWSGARDSSCLTSAHTCKPPSLSH